MRGRLLLAMLAGGATLALMPGLAAADGAKHTKMTRGDAGYTTAVMGDTQVRITTFDTHPNPARTAWAPSLVTSWPINSRNVANDIIARYGQPTAWSNEMLHWDNAGPWDYIAVHRDPIQHTTPFARTEHLQLGIAMDVPNNHLSTVNQLGLQYDPQRRIAFVPAESEAHGFLSFNLGNDLLSGRMTASDALNQFNTINRDFPRYRTSSQFTTGLNFDPRSPQAVAGYSGVRPGTQVYAQSMQRGAVRGYDRGDRMHARGGMVWDECACRWVCATGWDSGRTAYWQRGSTHAYNPYQRGYYGSQPMYRDEGVVAGYSGYMDRGLRTTYEVDAERFREYNMIFGSGYGARYGMSPDFGGPWGGETSGWVNIDGQRRWVSQDQLMWQNDRWIWRDSPNTEVWFDNDSVGVDRDRFDIDSDRFDIDPDRFNVDTDRLEIDPDRFDIDPDRFNIN